MLSFAGLILLWREQSGNYSFVSYEISQDFSSFWSALGWNQELFILLFKRKIKKRDLSSPANSKAQTWVSHALGKGCPKKQVFAIFSSCVCRWCRLSAGLIARHSFFPSQHFCLCSSDPWPAGPSGFWAGWHCWRPCWALPVFGPLFYSKVKNQIEAGRSDFKPENSGGKCPFHFPSPRHQSGTQSK